MCIIVPRIRLKLLSKTTNTLCYVIDPSHVQKRYFISDNQRTKLRWTEHRKRHQLYSVQLHGTSVSINLSLSLSLSLCLSLRTNRVQPHGARCL